MDEENQQLDTSTETATESVQTGESSDVQQGAEQQQESSDWRVKKYGDNWKDNIQYHTETNDYLRKELDKAKAQARRSVRGIEQEDAPRRPAQTGRADDEDLNEFKGETTQEFKDFMEKRMERLFESKLEARERESRFRSTWAAAREKELGDADHGIPSFAELEESHLKPLIEGTRTERDILIPKGSSILRELLRHIPGVDAGQAGYTLGLMLHAQNMDGLRKMFAGQAREEFAKKINETAKNAATVKNGGSGRTTGKLTPADINNMPMEEFSKFRQKQRGLTA